MNQDISNVILVVKKNKANTTLGHDKYQKVFSQFGTIQRMLIFERSLTWKTFVEFEFPESANKARQIMNDKLFCDDPQLPMNVYASKLTYITFQEHNTSGVGYPLIYHRLHITEKIIVANILNTIIIDVYSIITILNAILKLNVLINLTDQFNYGIIIISKC